MSIESFCSKYPESDDVWEIIDSIKKREFREGKSSVVILAEQLVREGRDGIREIINRLNPDNTMLKLTPEDFKRLSEEDKEGVFNNYAALVFGVCVVALEDTLVTRKYNHADWCERYNLATWGMQLSNANADVKIQNLSSEQMERMYFTVKQDKTFSLFFQEKGIQAMPDPMRVFLEQTQILPVIRKSILPIFRQRAELLVSS